MEQRDEAIEIKVGALVVFALALLAGFVFVLGDFAVGSGRNFKVVFENAGGLKPGADVAIAGLNVGRVESLDFVEQEEPTPGAPAVAVEVHVHVAAEHADSIREGSEFYISTRSVLGEPYIEVTTPSLDSEPIASGATVRGTSPPRVDLIAGKAAKVLDAITELIEDPDVHAGDMLASTASLIAHLDDFFVKHRGELSKSVSSASKALVRANEIMLTLNMALGEGESLKAIMRDTRTTMANTRNITGKMNGKVGPLLADALAIADNTKHASATADRLLSNNEAKITESIDNVHASTQELATMSGRAQKVVARIEDGEGTVGQLLQDREMYDDMRELLRIIKREPWKIIWKE